MSFVEKIQYKDDFLSEKNINPSLLSATPA